MTDNQTLRLCIEDLGHRFGRQRLFKGIDVELQSPGSLCVAGPNGSGKSTFLKIITGLLQPSRGTTAFYLGERRLSASAARSRLGYVAPDLQLYGELTALENLEFFARLRHLREPDARRMERLAEVGLEDRAQVRVGGLSSGQRQRLKYAVATLHEPELLLLDEPTANLDDAGRGMVAQIVDRQRRQGMLIVATNEKEEYAFGDRLVNLVA